MTIQGSYDPQRLPWVVKLLREFSYGQFVVDAVWTPDDPGPLVGTWEFSEGVNGDCQHGELGLDADPLWPPDSRVLLVWEQPDTTQPPDFIGTVGLIRGARDPSGGAYTLPVLGLGDIDIQGRAGSYSAFNLGDVVVTGAIAYRGVVPLPTQRGDTVEAHHSRMTADYPDASFGVRGDGVRVLGRVTTGAYALSAAAGGPVYDLSLTGYERQKSVNETDADAGTAWALRSETGIRPGSLTPRVLAAASTGANTTTGSVNLVTPDIEAVPPISCMSVDSLPHAETIDQDFTAAPVAVSGSWPAQPTAFLKFAYAIPISDLVRASASTKDVQNATFDLKALMGTVGATVTARDDISYTGVNAPAGLADNYDIVVLPGRLEVSAVHFISATAPNYNPQGSLSSVLTAQANFNFRTSPAETYAAQSWGVQLQPEDDFLSGIYTVLNGGNYFWKVALVVQMTAFAYQATRKAGADPGLPGKQFYTSGHWTLDVQVDNPKMVRDVLASDIPGTNLPDAWGSPPVSPPTAQGKVAGRLKGPCVLTDLLLPDGSTISQPITQYRRARTYAEYYTEFQSGGSQTRVLTKAEGNLQATRERRLMTSLGVGPL